MVCKLLGKFARIKALKFSFYIIEKISELIKWKLFFIIPFFGFLT
nr:MAG TPA: hypothetical protein [Caudoviricetes sp.]